MKTLTRLLILTLAGTVLATAPTIHAGHQHTLQLASELERETDHLLDDIKNDYRHRGHPTCGRSPEGRLYDAIKEVEQQADTLHSRIRKNRSACSQAEAFAAIQCAFEDAGNLLRRVDLDRHSREVMRDVERHIARLACEFNRHSRISGTTSNQHHAHLARPQWSHTVASPYPGQPQPNLETLLLARLLSAFDR